MIDLKLLYFFLGIGFYSSAMLEHKNALARAGVVCSIGSYYCLAKAIDGWTHSSGSQQDKEKLYSFLRVAAGLKTVSFAFAAPQLAHNNKSVAWAVKEMGSFYMGAGIYVFESACRKYHESRLHQDEAMQDFCMSAILATAGCLHIILPGSFED